MVLTISNRFVRTARRRCGQSGYTILEVIIVMGLVGIFIAAVIPNFSKIIPEMKVDKAASKLATDLRMAQQRAISEMAIVRFRAEVDGERYYAMVKARDTGGLWYQDNFDEYVEDPLNSSAIVLMDFNDPESKFYGLDILSVEPWFAYGEQWGFYFSPLGDLRWPFESITITISDPKSGYSRSVLITYPMGKISVLP
ncbi:Tfp pilus assembly protein FimT/FimU [Candidatus Zixiibacteriota bacterium]